MSDLQNENSINNEINQTRSASNDTKSSMSDLIKRAIDNDAERLRSGKLRTTEPETDENVAGMFRIRTAQAVLNQAALQPDPVVLYPNLIVENELTIVFADTGIGKTVCAVQMGIHIAADRIVLYVDLELSDKQFEKRYRSSNGDHYQFPANFYRADFTPRFQAPNGISYEQYFIQSLEQAIERIGADVVIIDNMTKLAAGDTDSAKSAIPILENLSRLKFDMGLTIIILEHNKKVDPFRPIALNDLQGSKMKSNFADAVFSIGRSATDKNLRYIKQLKVRSAELVFDTENVATYELTTEGGFLHFAPIGYSSEFEHLRQADNNEKTDRGADQYAQIQELRRIGFEGARLAEKIGITKSAISKIESKHRPKSEVSPTVSQEFPVETLEETLTQ